MRRWLLIHTGGDPLDSLARGEFRSFTSGDGDEPEAGDLHDAAVELYEQRGVPKSSLECTLVPLDSARTVSFEVGLRASVTSTGGPT
jgi:hypothetical protein